MRQISLEKGRATASLNRDFYPIHILQQSASKFRNLAGISVKAGEGRAIVAIEAKPDENAEEIALHFCNYALSLKQELGAHA